MRIPVESDLQIEIESHLDIARSRMVVGDIDNALANALWGAQALAKVRADWVAKK